MTDCGSHPEPRSGHRKTSRRPNASLVVALLALFVALGGTSYAALKITGRQVVNGSLTGADVRNGSLTLDDLSAKATKTLIGEQGPPGVAGPAGPAGAQGQAGAKGDKGAAGATNLTVRASYGLIASGGVQYLSVSCNAGEKATGGGAYWDSPSVVPNLLTSDSAPTVASQTSTTPTGWSATMQNGSPDPYNANVYVVCAAP